MGATGGSIVTAGTGSIAIGGASLTGGETVGTTGATSVCAGSMVSVDKRLRLSSNDSIASSTALVISLLSPVSVRFWYASTTVKFTL